MPTVGIRALKNGTSEIIRAVRDEKIEYTITYHGKPVAMIQPVDVPGHIQVEADPLLAARQQERYWARLDELAAEIDAGWASDRTAVEQVEEQRREL